VDVAPTTVAGADTPTWVAGSIEAFCAEAACATSICLWFPEYLKAGIATALEIKIPRKTPRTNWRRVAEKYLSWGTSCVTFNVSEVDWVSESNFSESVP
jgi:hypothetical protein